jgi:hypothetical protein
VDHLRRDELLEVFHKYCVPFGQRKYRDTGRGKILNQTRNLSPEPVIKLNVINNVYSNNRKLMNCDKTDRIKPPPDLLSGHLKRIKLDIKPALDVNTSKRKMSFESVSFLL